MGEALIDLVHQYPALWDKQDIMYKDSSYKDAKWKEIAEILHLTKEDVIKKWKSLRDTYLGLTQSQQVPMPMSQHQQSYNYSVNSDGSTFTSF